MSKELFKDFKWDFESEIEIRENRLQIKALPKSDYFVDPSGEKKIMNAPYFYTEANKDFVLRAKVTRQFKSTYDACVLMVQSSETCWVKLCFEFTDLGTNAVVSVVTNGVSDDANGVDIQGDMVYMQIAKKGDLFALHYSLNGVDYKMTRYFRLAMKETFKVGFVAQSPTGEGGNCIFEEIQLSYEPIKDLRKGS
jgi:regulation of enolase protein 1 (concanavalin A-like superfamily)